MASKIRNRILEHAVRCFAARGFAGSSTKEIAVAADVTEGSLFRLFISKEKLFLEVLDLCRSVNMLPQEEFERLLNSGNVEQGIQRAFTAMYKNISPDAVRVSRFAILERGDRAIDALSPIYKARIQAVAKRIRKGIAFREVRKNVDPTIAATVLYFTVRNLGFDLLIPKRSKKAQLATVERFINVVLRGILT